MDREHQKGTVATIGAFDGVHVGHVKILEKVSERAEKMGLGAAVFTFDPHPDEVLGKLKEKRFLLTTPREKHALLSNLGIEIEVVLEFTAAMGRLGASQFVKKYLLKPLCLKELVIGHDFRLGRGRKGDREVLRALGSESGFTVIEVEAVILDGLPVSSTRVRQAVSAADMELAARLLGRGYSMEGEIIPGDGIGARIGFPTANLSLDEKKLLPPDGVYAAYAETPGGTFRAAVNVGVRPTVGGDRRQVEAFIIGLSGELQANRLRLVPVARVRSERKFPGLKDLRNAIKQDVETVSYLLDKSSVKSFL
jgi:riboflavin kinase/FMN adenylyltransferase